MDAGQVAALTGVFFFDCGQTLLVRVGQVGTVVAV